MVAVNNECERRQGSGDVVAERAGGRRDKTEPS